MQSSWRRVLDSISSGSSTEIVVDPPPLDLLGARYQVLNRIGRGGMGAVYRALDRLTGRVVTLKWLRVALAQDGSSGTGSGARLELAREFTLLASLRHPNIVSVLDYGFDSAGIPFFTMELEENAVTIVEAGRGRRLPADTAASHHHFGQAAAIFAQLGSTWELAAVRALRDGRGLS